MGDWVTMHVPIGDVHALDAYSSDLYTETSSIRFRVFDDAVPSVVDVRLVCDVKHIGNLFRG